MILIGTAADRATNSFLVSMSQIVIEIGHGKASKKCPDQANLPCLANLPDQASLCVGAFVKYMPCAVAKNLGWLKARLVPHFLALCHVIAKIKPWQIQFCRTSDQID